MATSPHRVVILGGGFGGLYTYLGLHRRLHGTDRVTITLVSNSDAFCFVTLLHEVATGALLPTTITQSIRTLPQCCLSRFVEGRALAVDADRKIVRVTHRADGEPHEIPYDTLVLALGSTTHFFDTPGAADHALTLKDLDDAKRLKNRIIDRFEEAREATDSATQEALLRFVVVGGGPTGVELTGELADYLHDECSAAFPELQERWSVITVHSNDRLVPQVGPWFHRQAHRILRSKPHVSVLLNRRVTAVRPDGVVLGDEFIASRNVIWTAGVRARDIDLVSAKPITREPKSQRILVQAYLQLANYPEVFVVGDQAWIVEKESGQPYPMRAQFAVHEGDVAAENIRRALDDQSLKEFTYRNQGFIVSLGKGGALAELFGIRFRGPFAWWLYRSAYATKIVGWRARLRTILEWTLDLFFPRDLQKL